MTAEQADVDNDVKALEEQNRVNKQYRQRWKTLKGRLASADADQFYKNFQANLRKKGVTQKSHSKGYGEKLKRVDARRVPYQFNLECNLQSLANLLASMDNMKDFLRAENVSITPQKSGRFQVSMSVSTLVAETGEKK